MMPHANGSTVPWPVVLGVQCSCLHTLLAFLSCQAREEYSKSGNGLVSSPFSHFRSHSLT